MKLWASPNQAVSVSQIQKRAKDVIVRPPLGQSCFTECWLPISHHQDTPVPSPAKNFIQVSVKWTSDDRLPVILLKSLAERFPAACRAHPHPTNTGGELITPLGRRRPRSAQSSPAAAAHREPSRAVLWRAQCAHAPLRTAAPRPEPPPWLAGRRAPPAGRPGAAVGPGPTPVGGCAAGLSGAVLGRWVAALGRGGLAAGRAVA